MGADMDAIKKLKLTKLVKGYEEITELEFRELTMGDIKKMNLKDPSLEDLLQIAVKISNAPAMAFCDGLSIDDGLKVAEIVGELLDPSQKIGKKPSGS